MTCSAQSGHGVNGTTTERPRSPDRTELEDDMRRDGGGGNAAEGGDDDGVCELGLGEHRARERAAGGLGQTRCAARSDQVCDQVGGQIF